MGRQIFFRNQSVAVTIIIIDHRMQKEKNMARASKKSADAAKLLDLYIRNNNKQALLVHTQQSANLTHISTLITNRFHVPSSDQLLFYNGQQVRPTPERNSLDVEDKAIIHLVDRRNLTDNIVINVRRLNIPRVEQFRVPSSQIIEDFIVRNIQQEEANRLFLVYTGRELNPRRSFAEEFVENKSELFCLDEVKDELTGEQRAKYEKRMKKQSKKEVTRAPITITNPRNRNECETIKQASVQSEDVTFNTPPNKEEKKEEEEIKTPNFKKKNISQQINLGQNDVPVIQVIPNSHQNSTSLVTDANFHENKSALAPNPFFNEGSSISSICSEQNHNPQSSKRLDEPSVMFNSAYMGLNNENQGLTSRGGSLIANQSDSREQQPRQEGSKISCSFQNRAPELVVPDRQFTALDREEIIEESKEDYPDSKELSAHDIGSEKANSPKKEKDNSKDLSGYELQSIEHHQLSASAELEVETFQNRENSNSKNKNQNQILIEDFQRNDSKTLEYLGEEIEPIAYSHHQINEEDYVKQIAQEGQASSKAGEENLLSTPRFDESPRQLDVYLIQHSELAQPTQSEMVEEKEERETNRQSSNFYSSNSSRARQYDLNNQYNFGQFERCNRNRFSGYREGLSKYNQSQIETPKSEHHEEIPEFKENPSDNLGIENTENNRKKSIDDDHSLNIVELPIEARIKENSSLLIDYESKSDFNFNNPSSSNIQVQKQPANKNNNHDFEHQNSGIDELNKLFSQIGEKPNSNQEGESQKQVSSNSSSLEKQIHNKSEPELGLVHHEHEHPPEEEIIETSLNLRMSRKQSKDNELVNSPILIKEIKGVIDSSESLEKIEVKNSLPYFNSYTRSISSEMRFTNHKDVYNIGDFIFSCEINTFSPLTYFIDVLSRQDSLDVYRSYP